MIRSINEDKQKRLENSINKKKEVDDSKISNKDLNTKLSEWNKKYSQTFKFQNNKPKKVLTKPTELKNVLSPTYSDKAIEGLQKISKFLLSPNFNEKIINIEGFTSSTGDNNYNQSLSERRAESVLNSIKHLMNEYNKDKKEISVKLNSIGYGERKDKLVIINDTDTQPLKINGKIDDSIQKAILNDPEKRQEINRRVKIRLDKFPITDVITVNDTTKDILKGSNGDKVSNDGKVNVDKPQSPNPQDLKFNLNSYILKKESETLLSKFANNINKWNENNEDDDKIKRIYISAHTLKGKEDNEEQKKERDESVFFLSNNRAFTVKKYLQEKLKEKNINFYLYPVSHTLGEEKKVVIHFDNSKHMQECKKNFNQLAQKYDVESSDNGYNGKNYVKNVAMRKVIIKNLKDLMKARTTRPKIPLELWYTEGRFGLGQEESFKDFKQEMLNIIGDEKGFVYKSE